MAPEAFFGLNLFEEVFFYRYASKNGEKLCKMLKKCCDIS